MSKQTKKVNKKTTQVKTTPVTVVKTTKVCPKCGRELALTNFPHDYRRKDTLYIYCRECEAKRQYVKHTKNIITAAEENGYTVLKITSAAPTLSIDTLKIDVNPNTGRTIETELAPTQ